jgi:ribosome-associated protein
MAVSFTPEIRCRAADRYDNGAAQFICIGKSNLMSRKSRKGYYVDGAFVSEGSERDRALKAERQGTEPSRSELKQESERLQALGLELLTLRGELLDSLPLTERLQEAVAEAGRITSPEAMRRHKQLIGKLMREQEPATVEAISAAVKAQHGLR